MRKDDKPNSDKDPELVQLGLTVRAIRKEKGYSQEGFADKAGIDRSYYGGIERGEHNIAVLKLLQIADTLNVRVGVLFQDRYSGNRSSFAEDT
jgi:transcriptional regulator with XRE-family HTH domain